MFEGKTLAVVVGIALFMVFLLFNQPNITGYAIFNHIPFEDVEILLSSNEEFFSFAEEFPKNNPIFAGIVLASKLNISVEVSGPDFNDFPKITKLDDTHYYFSFIPSSEGNWTIKVDAGNESFSKNFVVREKKTWQEEKILFSDIVANEYARITSLITIYNDFDNRTYNISLHGYNITIYDKDMSFLFNTSIVNVSHGKNEFIAVYYQNPPTFIVINRTAYLEFDISNKKNFNFSIITSKPCNSPILYNISFGNIANNPLRDFSTTNTSVSWKVFPNETKFFLSCSPLNRTEKQETVPPIFEKRKNLAGRLMGKIIVGKPVKWRILAKINETNITLRIPPQTTNFTIWKKVGDKKYKIPDALFTKLGGSIHIFEKGEIEIEYETEAPRKTEKILSEFKKIIQISAPELNYTDVVSYTNISEITSNKNNIHLYWITNGTKKEHDFIAKDTNNNGLVDYIEWVIPHLSNQTFEVSITILNLQSYPVVGGEWRVEFNTTGIADLRIRPVYGTEWGKDLKFLGVWCGDRELNYKVEGDAIVVKNYGCDKTGVEVSKVISKGKHHLEFDFGGEKAYAHNFASYWWNKSWNYRMPITITNTSAVQQEYQIILKIDTQSLINAGKMNSSCRDMRFVDDTNTPIPYYLENSTTIGCNSTTTYIWVKVPYIDSTENTTIFMYYGNPNATSLSSKYDVFNFSSPQPIYYIVQNLLDNPGDLKIVSFRDNNNITIEGNYYLLNETDTTTVADTLYNQNSSLDSTKPIFASGNGDNQDAVVPISFASKEFVNIIGRGSQQWSIYSPFGDAEITVYDGNNGAGFTLVGTSFTVTQGSASTTAREIAGTSTSSTIQNTFRVNASLPVLLFHHDSGGRDAMPVYPLADELYCFVTRYHIGWLHDGTYCQILDSQGGNTTGIWNASDEYWKDYGTATRGEQGVGVHIVCNDSVGSHEYADEDGSESAVCLPEWELDNEYYIPNNAEYIAIVSPVPGVNCTVYAPDGSVRFTGITSGSNNYPFPSRLNFGADASTNLYAGDRLVCNHSVYTYLEDLAGSGGDEHNLWNVKQFRKKTYPEPEVFVGEEQTGPPNIENAVFNTSLVLVGNAVRLNVTVTDPQGNDTVLSVNATFEYPNGTQSNVSLSPLSYPVWFYDWSDTGKIGQYNVTSIYASDGISSVFKNYDSLSFFSDYAPNFTNPKSSPSSPTNYNNGPYQFNISVNDLELDKVIFESNFSGGFENTSVTSHVGNEYYITFQELPAGYFQYKWYANDTYGVWNSSSPHYYQINKISPTIHLALNGTEDSKTYTYPDAINVTGWVSE